MANQKATAKGIIENRVNGVIKSFETFKISLKNNRSKISEKDFNAIIEFLSNRTVLEIEELRKIYNDKEDTFQFKS